MARRDDFNAKDRIDLRLLENGIHFLNGEIQEDNINDAIKWLAYENLNAKDSRVLTLYINSPGGDLYQAFALIDAMRANSHVIRTVGMGSVMSSAFLIFASGDKGERYIAANTGIMCHQYSDDHGGKHHDLKATMKEGEYCNNRMVEILKDATGLPVAKIKAKLLPATDVYLTSAELVDLGVADQVL